VSEGEVDEREEPFFSLRFVVATVLRAAPLLALAVAVRRSDRDWVGVALALASMLFALIERAAERSAWRETHGYHALVLAFWGELALLVFAREQAIYVPAVVAAQDMSAGLEAVAREARTVFLGSAGGDAAVLTIAYTSLAIACAALTWPRSSWERDFAHRIGAASWLSIASGASVPFALALAGNPHSEDKRVLTFLVAAAVGLIPLLIASLLLLLPLALLDAAAYSIAARLVASNSR
jgi:hypothetical protein